MAEMKWLTCGGHASLTDQTHLSALSLYRTGKGQIVGRCKVTGIDEDDPIQIWRRREAHQVIPFRQFCRRGRMLVIPR